MKLYNNYSNIIYEKNTNKDKIKLMTVYFKICYKNKLIKKENKMVLN